jgi:hypothetical protein
MVDMSVVNGSINQLITVPHLDDLELQFTMFIIHKYMVIIYES